MKGPSGTGTVSMAEEKECLRELAFFGMAATVRPAKEKNRMSSQHT